MATNNKQKEDTSPFVSWEDFEKQFSDFRVDTGGEAPAASTATEPADTSVDRSGSLSTFDVGQIRNDRETTRQALEEAEDELSGFQSRRYDEEYENEGLGEMETEISKLDNEIADKKQMRDTSVSKTRRNPFYSAATITGETGEIERQANRSISNAIDERNSVAEQYNTKIGQVNDRIAQEAADRQRRVKSLRYDLNRLDQQMNNYREELRYQLENESSEDRWEKEFAVQLAQVQDSLNQPSTSVSEYEANGTLYRDVVNTETGEVISRNSLGSTSSGSSGGGFGSTADERYSNRVSQGLEPDPGLRATAQRLVNEGVTDPTWRGYTGELATRLEAEMSWLQNNQSSGGGNANSQNQSSSQGQQRVMEEGELRRYVRDQWSDGESDEAVRDRLQSQAGNIQIEGSDQNATDVISDEYDIKTKGGVTGWFGRLFRAGV